MRDHFIEKTAIITGGASGIGLALGEMLLEFGAKAVTLADLNRVGLENQCARLSAAYPGKVLGVPTDVGSAKSVNAMVRDAADFGGGIDFLFNNAGLGLFKLFDETSDEDWKAAFDINFYGALYGIRAALPIMRAQGGGHIANTASGIVFSPMPFQSMYSATKSALLGLGTSLRYELWDENIRVSTVIPGTVATAIWGDQPPPKEAITPQASAQGILAGVARNERIIIVTEPDRIGTSNTYDAEKSSIVDEYMLNIARKRRAGVANEF